jgi:hypothetical protein
MKKYLLFAFSGALALLVTLNLTAFKAAEKEEAQDYVLVEIYEIPSYKDKGVHIHYGNGKTEVLPFKEFKKENHDDNGEIILKAINDLGKKGYKIDHVASGLAQSGMITKLFMVRK